MKQERAFKILKKGENIFLTGSAGSGKTFLLNKFIDYLKEKKIKVGVTASTGVAATHLGGRTIHSWVGMGIEEKLDEKKMKKLILKKDVRKRIRDADVLIIDEISMLDANRLDLVDKICKAIKDPFKSFGGLQIVLCGDFFQLPPVDPQKRAEFAFKAFSWRQSNINVCYLDEQFRHDDIRLTNILNKIRNNVAGMKEMNFLQNKLNRKIKSFNKSTRLYTHNADVDAINARELRNISGREKKYKMSTYGKKELIIFLKKNCLVPEELSLKIGAIVMFVKNNFEEGYVNGTLGTVINFNNDGYPVVKIKSNNKIIAMPMSWNLEDNGEVLASIKQVPLRLAWAITVHKSQGMSLDTAEIDLSRSFEPGMGYVALSRVRTMDGISLLGINEMSIKVNQEVFDKDKEFINISKKLDKNI